MKIFVGNLSTEASEDDLRQACEAFGQITSVSIAADDEGQPKGFGFVEMASKSEGEALLAGLTGQEIKGQAVKATEARPDSDRRSARGNQTWSSRGGFAGKDRVQKGSSKASGNTKGGFSTGKSSGHKV